jgi:hypothetical protein
LQTLTVTLLWVLFGFSCIREPEEDPKESADIHEPPKGDYKNDTHGPEEDPKKIADTHELPKGDCKNQLQYYSIIVPWSAKPGLRLMIKPQSKVCLSPISPTTVLLARSKNSPE